MPYIYIILGFFLLIAGADYLVRGASSLAKKLKVSDLIIGLTIVSIGTSAPELAVNVLASIKGSPGMAIGNIIGSNLLNLLMVLGVTALVRPISFGTSLIKIEIPFVILATIALLLLAGDSLLYSGGENILSKNDGAILLLFFLIFIYYLFLGSKSEPAISEVQIDSRDISWMATFIMLAGGLAAVLWGGDFIVKNGIIVARSWGVSESLIGLTIVAVGTSLPELATSVVAAVKGNNDLAIGNVVGSNIFNILMILGITSLIAPLPFSNENLIDTAISLGATLTVLWIARVGKGRVINRKGGAVLIVFYLAVMIYILSR